MNSVTMKSPISELERFTRLRIRSGVTGAKTALAPQYLRKLRKGLNLNYFGKKTVKKEPFQNYLVKKTPEARACIHGFPLRTRFKGLIGENLLSNENTHVNNSLGD
jgi:hypothetical protein